MTDTQNPFSESIRQRAQERVDAEIEASRQSAAEYVEAQKARINADFDQASTQQGGLALSQLDELRTATLDAIDRIAERSGIIPPPETPGPTQPAA